MKPEPSAEWMSTEEAARFLGFTNQSAFAQWVKRERVKSDTNPRPLKVYRLGKRLLRFRRVDLERRIEVVTK
jgi:hypothetical protein